MNISENAMIEPGTYLGVDRNTTGHIAVVGNPVTGKILKLGKQANMSVRNTGTLERTFRGRVNIRR